MDFCHEDFKINLNSVFTLKPGNNQPFSCQFHTIEVELQKKTPLLLSTFYTKVSYEYMDYLPLSQSCTEIKFFRDFLMSCVNN